MTNYIIRKALSGDAPRIAYVRITGWHQSYKGIIPDALLDKLDIDDDETRVRAAIEDITNKSLRFVVETEGVVTGIGACGPARGGHDEKRAAVYAIYLLDETKGRGIGSAFMRHMAGALAEAGYESLEVGVLEKNETARKFYEKLGGKLKGNGIFSYEGFDLPDVTYFWDDIRVLMP